MKRAFTLIELLVVIAIIAILAAILFPVFAQAKAAAKKTSDLSNLKQANTAAQIYLSDSDDNYPITVPENRGTTLFTTPWDRTPTANPTLRQTMYVNSLQPYMKNFQMFTSPGSGSDWLPFGAVTPNPTNFALSYHMNGYLNAFTATAMDNPSRVIVFWTGSGKTKTPGYSFSYPLVLTKTLGWLDAPEKFPGTFRFERSGDNCVSGYGYWGGPAGSEADMNIFTNGMNVARGDGHAKYVRNGHPDSPVAAVDPRTGRLQSYWVNSATALLAAPTRSLTAPIANLP